MPQANIRFHLNGSPCLLEYVVAHLSEPILHLQSKAGAGSGTLRPAPAHPAHAGILKSVVPWGPHRHAASERGSACSPQTPWDRAHLAAADTHSGPLLLPACAAAGGSAALWRRLHANRALHDCHAATASQGSCLLACQHAQHSPCEKPPTRMRDDGTPAATSCAMSDSTYLAMSRLCLMAAQPSSTAVHGSRCHLAAPEALMEARGILSVVDFVESVQVVPPVHPHAHVQCDLPLHVDQIFNSMLQAWQQVPKEVQAVPAGQWAG